MKVLGNTREATCTLAVTLTQTIGARKYKYTYLAYQIFTGPSTPPVIILFVALLVHATVQMLSSCAAE